MNKALGIGLVIAGVILLVFGFQESESLGSEVSRFFTGNPTNRSMWLIGIGAAALAAGLILTFAGRQKK